MQVSLDKNRSICDFDHKHTFSNYKWIHYVVMVLAVVSLIAHYNYILGVSDIYDKLRARYQRDQYSGTTRGYKHLQNQRRKSKIYRRSQSNISLSKKSAEKIRKKRRTSDDNSGTRPKIAVKWKHLTFSEKMKLFDPWCIVIMASNLFQIIGCLSILLSRSTTLAFNELMVGLGCFGAWVGLLRFMNTDPKLYSAPNTVKRAAPVILNMILGVVPILIGF